MRQYRWRPIGASMQGPAHIQEGKPCQDMHDYRVLATGGLIVAVADGAGSAEFGHEGAAFAVRQVIETVTQALERQIPSGESGWHGLMADGFEAARETILRHAEERGVPARSVATTLTCLILTDEHTAGGQIGDGAVVAERADGSLLTAMKPRRGEYANTTYFLTHADMRRYLDLWVCPAALRTVVVMTDGLWRLALRVPGYEPHLPFFRPLLAFAQEVRDDAQAREQLATFLASDRVASRTDDDKTLVLGARLEVDDAAADTEADTVTAAPMEASGGGDARP